MTRQSSGSRPERVWLITGATSGFGRALADTAIAAGDIVVGAARSPERLDELVAENPGRAGAVRLDVTDTASCAAVVDQVAADYGRIDVLVNNAGRTQVGALEETTDSELRALFDLHFPGLASPRRPRTGRSAANSRTPRMSNITARIVIPASRPGGGRPPAAGPA